MDYPGNPSLEKVTPCVNGRNKNRPPRSRPAIFAGRPLGPFPRAHLNDRKSHRVAGRETLQSDRKSTRLHSSHVAISYPVLGLKKKNTYRRQDSERVHEN